MSKLSLFMVRIVPDHGTDDIVISVLASSEDLAERRAREYWGGRSGNVTTRMSQTGIGLVRIVKSASAPQTVD
jgi:hypothetical protein